MSQRNGLSSLLPLLTAFLGGCIGFWLFTVGVFATYSTGVGSGCVVGLFLGYVAARLLERYGMSQRLETWARLASVAALLAVAIALLLLAIGLQESSLLYAGLFAAALTLFPSVHEVSPNGLVAVAKNPRTPVALLIFLALSVVATFQTGDFSWVAVAVVATLALAATLVLRRRERSSA